MHFILSLIIFTFLSFNVFAFQDRGEVRIHGVAEVKDAANTDMWDKKNEALKDAKLKATVALVRRLLSPEEFVSLEERIRKEIAPSSARFLIGQDIQKHGLDNPNSYSTDVVFKYSLKNLKAILNDNGIYFREVREPKIASFIEVMDYSKIKTHRWWTSDDKNIEVHRALVPLRKEMMLGMQDQGFKLLPPMKVINENSLKDSAIAQGAHYYIKGKLKVVDDPKGFQVNDGEFYIYEAFSQKLVATLDLKELQRKMNKIQAEEQKTAARNVSNRGPASIPSVKPEKQNVIRASFKEAALKMASSSNQSLNSGITIIKVSGVNQPEQIEAVRASLQNKLGSKVGSVIERRIEKGSVEFSVRTSSPTNTLINLINRASYNGEDIALQEAELMANGKGLSVRIR